MQKRILRFRRASTGNSGILINIIQAIAYVTIALGVVVKIGPGLLNAANHMISAAQTMFGG